MKPQFKAPFRHYACWVFDCDGVLLDSNAVKTQAFHDVASRYGSKAADQLVAFHVEQGGISRFVKFQHLFDTILGRAPEPGEMDDLLEAFTQAAKARLMACPTAPGLEAVLQAAGRAGPVFVVSGGMQSELRDVFAQRGLDGYFTAIFGSPDTKDDILARERASGAMPDPAVFVGDAKYDFEVAKRFEMDFVFATRYSEFAGWKAFFDGQSVPVISTLADLLEA